MPETAETPASEPEPQAECPKGQKRDKDGNCVPIESEGAGEPAAAAEKGMFAAVKAVMTDALEEMRKEIMASAKNIMQEELAKIQKEFASGLRKELGLNADPTVTKTEMTTAIRKAVLDLKVTDKRTPQGKPLQKATEDTPKAGDIFSAYTTGAN